MSKKRFEAFELGKREERHAQLLQNSVGTVGFL